MTGAAYCLNPSLPAGLGSYFIYTFFTIFVLLVSLSSGFHFSPSLLITITANSSGDVFCPATDFSCGFRVSVCYLRGGKTSE